MSALVETLVTSLALSGLAASCLALLPHAPPRLKFSIAAAGVAAWLVPWSFVRDLLPDATLALPLAAGASRPLQPTGTSLDVGTLLAVTFAAATLIGLALFVADCVKLHRCIRRWRATSRPADELRSLLPPELAALPAEIRLVADSNVAATSGYLEPTIWIGDRYAGEQLRLTVVHEMWHARSRDPLWLTLLGAVRRAYWWNPLVAHLAREATLMLESTCDHRSAAAIGKNRYITELASLVLAGANAAPGLMATARCGNLDVQRVRLLDATLRVRARDVVVLATLGIGAAATALTKIAALETATTQTSQSVPAPAALATSSSVTNNDAAVLDDLLSTYAYTPQQLGGAEAAR